MMNLQNLRIYVYSVTFLFLMVQFYLNNNVLLKTTSIRDEPAARSLPTSVRDEPATRSLGSEEQENECCKDAPKHKDEVSEPASIVNKRLIRYNDWPESRFEMIRKDPSLRAVVPDANATTQPIMCPQCLSILAGSVQGMRILLLNHELLFGGAELLLLHTAELLEQSGASVRFLNLASGGPLLAEMDKKGMSYMNRKGSGKKHHPGIDFSDFDAVLANSAAVETHQHFFERTSDHLSSNEMDQLLQKTIFWIHELDMKMYTNPFLEKVLRGVGRVLFDSNSGRIQWERTYPEISNKSVVVFPSVKKDFTLKLLSTANVRSKRASRLELNIPARSESEDVVILQAASIHEGKGSTELLRSFSAFLKSVPSDVLQERSWFLVFVGHLVPGYRAKKFTTEVKEINTDLEKRGLRSRVLVRDASADIVPYYSAADIHVLNSPCENFGMVLVEAMIGGTPTIARACGGPTEITSHGKTGLLLPTDGNNTETMVSALKRMTMPADWQGNLNKMGRRAQGRALKMFPYYRMARELSNVFSNLFFTDAKSPWICCTSTETKSSMQHTCSHDSGTPPLPSLPVRESLFDLGCASLGNRLYVFGGYRNISYVSKMMQYYDLDRNTWHAAPPLPENAAESHQAIASDERYLYVVSGQLGSQCKRPVKSSFAYDTRDKLWMPIPDLPVARYGGCAGVLKTRLHFVGGLDIDRRTPRREHFSLSIQDVHSYLAGKTSVPPTWQPEPDIPHGSGHVLCRVLSSSANATELYYFGGETEDYYAKNPIKHDFSCVPGDEFNVPFVFTFDGHRWERGPDMPYPLSHAEQSYVLDEFADKAIFFGGSGVHEQEVTGNSPVLTDGILLFSAKTGEFQRIGSLYPVGVARKTMCGVARLSQLGDEKRYGTFSADIFAYAGQASQSTSLPFPGRIENFAMRCTKDRAELRSQV